MQKYKKATLKDIDFEYLSKKNAVKVDLHFSLKKQLIEIAERDSEFFKQHNIMDYSLLLAIEERDSPPP